MHLARGLKVFAARDRDLTECRRTFESRGGLQLKAAAVGEHGSQLRCVFLVHVVVAAPSPAHTVT